MRKRFLAFLTIALLITAAPALSSVDKTSSGEMIYFVMLDRFANGDPSNDDGKLGTNPKVSGLL
ncbi:MAG: alpha-amylase, partial [Actinobacteria bacterium]|nr:alpha-amylase [Actinomycetota bacterium]